MAVYHIVESAFQRRYMSGNVQVFECRGFGVGSGLLAGGLTQKRPSCPAVHGSIWLHLAEDVLTNGW